MSTITASQVSELRKRTGAAMMECKKALVESQGDIDVAIKNMREKGLAKADKKAGNITAEGIVIVRASADNKAAVMVEINCQTDFVARDENFTNFAATVADTALANKITDVEALVAMTATGQSVSIDDARKGLVTKLGENLSVRRITMVESSGMVASYIHDGRIGVLVAFEGGDIEVGKDVAMHVAAVKPEVVSPEDVAADRVNQEKEIFVKQAAESGKPAEIIEKMVGGRVKKFLGEISLTGQSFVKNPDQTVGQLLKEKNATVASFVRFEVGEGIEKKQENFADEVMAQVQGSAS